MATSIEKKIAELEMGLLHRVYKCVVCQGRGQDGHQHGEEDY